MTKEWFPRVFAEGKELKTFLRKSSIEMFQIQLHYEDSQFHVFAYTTGNREKMGIFSTLEEATLFVENQIKEIESDD